MQFRVLGDVSVALDEGELNAVVAPRQRALLAVLVLNANRVMTPFALVDAIWGDEHAPQHPEAALQVAMSRLRAALGSVSDRIRSDGRGYRLEAGPEEVDLTRVEMLLRDGCAALGLNDARRAAEFFDAALAMWNGDALEDLASFPFQAVAAKRIRELHYTVYEARNDAYLIDGRHLEVLDDIDGWVRADPLREHLRAQQVAALYRSGRQADALRECAALRRALRDLGIEPSAGIQDLERKVLDQDPGLFATAVGFSVPLPAWTSESLSFVGRDDECELVMAALRRACSDGLRFVLVDGEPGVGKSRFLLEFARRVGNDAIVLPVDVHESLQPSVTALTQTLRIVAQRMRPEDLRLTLGAAPAFDLALTRVEPEAADVLAGGAQWVAALSAKAPVVLIIDDLDRSGPTLLHLIAHLAVLDQPKRVLVVASARARTTEPAPILDALVSAIDRRGIVDRVTLHTLSAHDIDELLGRMRIGPGGEMLTAKLHELTAGSPFLLAELLSTGQPERLVDVWTVPPRVRDVVLARVDALGRAAAELLMSAALFERDFTIALLSEVFAIPQSAITTIVERAVDAHLLQPSSLHTYRFAHELTRRTLAAELDPAVLASTHRRIALAIERPGASPIGLAYHWWNADGPDAATKTIAYARMAGEEAQRMLEPQFAAHWYELALSKITTDHERGPVLVDLAEAQQQSGDTKFVETLREAARIAEETSNEHLLLRVVTSASPGWSTLPGFTTDETRRLLAKALEVCCDDATRSRVLARHATEQFLDDTDEGIALAQEAIAIARRSGDPVSLLEALYRHTPMLLMPATLEARERGIAEALPLAVQTRDTVAEYFLTSSAAVAAIQAGDAGAATACIAAADGIRQRCDIAPLRWSAMSRKVWQAGLAGRLDEAEQRLLAARDFGCRHGIDQAQGAALVQYAMLQWHQGVPSTCIPHDLDDASPLSRLPGVWHFLARSLADAPATRHTARRMVVELARDHFDDVPVGPFWSSILVATAETAFLLDTAPVGRVIRSLLEPYVDQIAFGGLWVAAPIAHGVAVAAAASHDPDTPELFEHAIAIADKLDAPLLRARTQLAWAAAIRELDPHQRPPNSTSLCDEASETGRTLHLEELTHREAEQLRTALSR